MKFSKIIINILIILFMIVSFLPLWAAITTSLKTLPEITRTSPLMFSSLYFGNYLEAWTALSNPMVNSLIFTTFATLFSTILGSIGGYMLTKIKFRWANPVFTFILLGMYLPYQSILIPLVQLMSRLGLYNTIPGLILTHTSYGIPICTLLFRNFYGFIPDSLIQAAKIDGAGTWRTYIEIVLPLSIIPFVVTGVYQFTRIWNDYLFGVVLTFGERVMPATVALANLKGSFTANYGLQMAGGILTTVPTLILFIFLGRYLLRGYTQGAMR
jgi:glucose/mannose transport system permease protein